MSGTVRPPQPAPTARKAADALLRMKVLRPEQYEAAIQHVARTGERSEEVLIETGILAEGDLLKSLATLYKTYFVSTEKLAKAEVPRAVLEMIPQRFAETMGVVPIQFDAKANTLRVVTADPDNLELLREVRLASGAREVTAILARPAAVKALALKGYTGDIHAFALLDRNAHAQFHAMLDVYERNLVSDVSMATALAKENPTRSRERVLTERDLLERPAAGARPLGTGTSGGEFNELLNVLVSLLENARHDLRGHSAYVARLGRRVAERMSLDPMATSALSIAAYTHDLGKMGQYHLTMLNVSEYDGHRVAAQRVYNVPTRLLESVQLPKDVQDALNHLYERYDGKGFPDGLLAKDIPLASRLLAILDTYADLTQNPRNPYRKALSPQEACAVLAKYKETVFDPHLVDLFRHTVVGEDLKARLLANRYQALIIDVDPEETTVLELRMIEQGFVVKTARTSEQAIKILAEGETDLVVSELELAGEDGMKLLSGARKQSWGRELPWVIYTQKKDRADTQRAFEHGVLDFVSKPASTDVLVAKLKALLDQRATPKAAGGVSGSLREMGLPDMVQVLYHGRKTGNLRIRSRGDAGEIHLVDGNIVNALWGELRGEDAFYSMLKLTEGDFGLDPSYRATARIIHQSSEALLLEGMRRLDEGL